MNLRAFSWLVVGCLTSMDRMSASDVLAGLTVPELEALVERGAGKQAAVWRVAQEIDRLLMARHASQRLVVDRRLPQEDRKVVAAGRQSLGLRALGFIVAPLCHSLSCCRRWWWQRQH